MGEGAASQALGRLCVPVLGAAVHKRRLFDGLIYLKT